MQINAEKTGVINGVGMDKLKVIVDGSDRLSVESTAARELAQKEASARGFSGGGLCEVPQTSPIGADGEILDGADALNPNAEVLGYRTEFTYAMRM